MNIRRRTLTVLSLGLFAVVSAPAWSADGRISFSGAVVEPTCSINPAQLPAPGTTSVQFGCGNAVAAAAQATQVLARSVTTLTADERDPALKYFSHYATAMGARRPVLLTQTYE